MCEILWGLSSTDGSCRAAPSPSDFGVTQSPTVPQISTHHTVLLGDAINSPRFCFLRYYSTVLSWLRHARAPMHIGALNERPATKSRDVRQQQPCQFSVFYAPARSESDAWLVNYWLSNFGLQGDASAAHTCTLSKGKASSRSSEVAVV